jgi:putative nucleotidyltransferase with HDIG domain
MISRSEALELLHNYVHEDSKIQHALSVEAIMNALADYLQQNQELWSMVGLLYDLDYEYTFDQPEKHAVLTAQIIQGLIPDKGINAILSHNYVHTNVIPTTTIDKALLISDAVTDLIFASAKSMISKKMKRLTISTIKKNLKDESFTDNGIKEKLLLCKDLGLNVNELLVISLKSLQKIHSSVL